MPRYYISADLEGVCGVSSPLQCYPKDDLSGYNLAVRQLATEVGAVVAAILDIHKNAQITVNDAHSRMTNLDITHLPSNVALLTGKPKLCAMMAGLDNTYDAAFLIGYHAKAGTERGVLNHTFHHQLTDVQINGVSYGEAGINTLYAHLVHQVPVALASGDQVFCTELSQQFSQIHTVETKVGLTTTAALHHPIELVLTDYHAKTHLALKAEPLKLLQLVPPYHLKIEFMDTLACDVVMTSPLYQRLDGRTVTFETDNFETLYRALQSAYTMLSYADYQR